MRLAAALLSAALVLPACGGSEATKPATTTKAKPKPKGPSAEEKAKAKKREEVTKALAEMDAEVATENERWTPELHAKATKLVARPFKNLKAGLKAVLASPHRVPGHADRDKARHPSETLTFFGLKPTSTVVELGAGEGWYTELLAPLLRNKGKLLVTSPDPDGPDDQRSIVYGRRLAAFLAKAPELFDRVEVSIIEAPDKLEIAPAGTVDLVIAIREMHGWHRRKAMAAYLKAVHNALKDGGTFGLVAHRAADDADPDESAPKGYLPQAWVIEQVEAAGFKLAGKSEVNANKKDTKDYEQGVWTLPPNFAEGDKDRDRYAEIGESDRMTLKFTKVAAPAGDEAEASDAGD